MSKNRKPTKRALKRRRTLAASRNNRRKTALGRLFTDGATSTEQVRKRIQWLAQEWKLPPEDVVKVMRCTTYEIGRFAEKYHVNYDWMLGGDLKGLRQMMQKRKARTSSSKIDPSIEFGKVVAKIRPQDMQKAVAVLKAIMERA
jgi:hypothetical protein